MPTVVVSSPQWAKRFLQIHDCDFSDRPRSEASKRLFYGSKTLVTMEHGATWRERRKMYTIQILTVKKIELFERARNREVAAALQQLITEQQARAGELVVDINKFVFNIVGNIMTGMLFSKRSFGLWVSHNELSEFKDMVLEMAVLFGSPIIGDVIPCLQWLDVAGYKKRMDTLAKRLDTFLEKVVRERLLHKDEHVDNCTDFLDLLLHIHQGDEGNIDTVSIKSILLDLLSAGTETSTTTVEWAMAELLQNPSCMKKLQQEVDTSVQNRSRTGYQMVEDTNLSELRYLKAVVKETLRLHPPLPLVVRQMSKTLVKGKAVGEYKLPPKTRLIVNVWAMGRDENLWPQAHQFNPSRFLDPSPSLDLRGQNFEFLPFGTGRRGCPGMNLGLAMVELVLANLVHKFEWRLPPCLTPHSLDMSELVCSRTAPKAKPLLVVFNLRSHSTLP